MKNPIMQKKEYTSGKGPPLSKDETKGLVCLIGSNKIIASKTTNATTNRLKNAAWNNVTIIFNSTLGNTPRTCNQLRGKWDNLKKMTRKRQMAKASHTEFVPPDEILDMVENIVNTAGEDFSADCGGDSKNGEDTEEYDYGDEEPPEKNEDVFVEENHINIANDLKQESPYQQHQLKRPNMFLKNGMKRRIRTDEGRSVRNFAIAEYFKAKKQTVLLKNEKLRLENEKLRLEIKCLKKSDTEPKDD